MEYENVEIIDHAADATKLGVKEILHILKTWPQISRELGSQSDNLIFIQAYS